MEDFVIIYVFDREFLSRQLTMASRMAMRYVSRRFSSSGKVLSEEEKAAENVYIKVNKYCCLFGILGFFFLIDLLDVAAGLQFTYAFSFDF